MAAWQAAAPLASAFWENLANDARLSPDFLRYAESAIAIVNAMRRRLT
jgi:hypothetical protein